VSLNGGAAATRLPVVTRPVNIRVNAKTVDVSFGKVAVHLADRRRLKVDLVSAHLRRLHLNLDISNGEAVPVRLLGHQQVLVTDDKDKPLGEQATFTIAAKGHRKVARIATVGSPEACWRVQVRGPDGHRHRQVAEDMTTTLRSPPMPRASSG
jgi:hypothetical protein